MTVATGSDLEIRIEVERTIAAPIEDVWEALLAELGPDFETPEGLSLSMRLEAHPGGRWYRDLGDGEGHLWGHVQAIKRPTLMELAGPLFMSQAVCNNVQYRLETEDGTTTLRLVHTGFGLLPEDVRDRMPEGWSHQMDRIERRVGR